MLLQSRGLAPLPIKGVLHGFKRPPKISMYPSGASLHWDANADPYTEQTGGPHTFNHAILSPQYQRNADGSYSNVGAKPAVDVFGGKKWLRSCGAVTNLLPSGDLTGWDVFAVSVGSVDADGFYPVTENTDIYPHAIGRSVTVTAGSYTFSVEVKKTSTRKIQLSFGGTLNGTAFTNFDPVTGEINAGGGATASVVQTTKSWIVSITVTLAAATGYVYIFAVNSLAAPRGLNYTGDGASFLSVKCPILTATSYPVPYTPPGTTMPASNATTTNGSWFTLPDGSELWKALTGEPLTLATRVRMGVLYNEVSVSNHSIIDPSGTVWLQRFGDGDLPYPVRAFDGTVSVSAPQFVWPRNSIIRRVTQVSADGTQFRVGYMIEGTHTEIQWSAWKAYDGSFGPSTLYRLMLGYNSPYPMWFSRITAWKEQVSDDRILEAWT